MGFRETDPYYFQVIIPLRKKISTHYAIDQYIFDSDLGYRSADGTLANFAGDALQVCVLNDEENYYLNIDFAQKQPYKKFTEKIHAVKKCHRLPDWASRGGRGLLFRLYPQREINADPFLLY
jgi:hypothetical protein